MACKRDAQLGWTIVEVVTLVAAGALVAAGMIWQIVQHGWSAGLTRIGMGMLIFFPVAGLLIYLNERSNRGRQAGLQDASPDPEVQRSRQERRRLRASRRRGNGQE